MSVPRGHHRGAVRLPPVSIRFFSLLVVILVALGTGVLISYFMTRYWAEQEDVAYEKFREIARGVARDLDDDVERAQENVSRLRQMTQNLDVLEPRTAVRYLENVMAENIRFHRSQFNTYIALEKPLARRYFGSDGYLLMVHKPRTSEDRLGPLPGNAAAEIRKDRLYQESPDETWYHMCKTSTAPVVGDIYFDKSYMRCWMFTVGLGFYDVGQRFEGMAGIDMRLDDMLAGVDERAIGKTGRILIADSKTGMVLTTHRSGDLLASQDRASVNQLEGADDQKGAGFPNQRAGNLYATPEDRRRWTPVLNGNEPAILANDQGEQYVVTPYPMSHLPWTVVAYQARSEFQESLRRGLIVFGLSAAALMVLLVVVAYILNTRIARPIHDLMRAMERVKGTEFRDVRAPIEGTIETRTLGVIFNQMLVQIADALRDKEAWYAQVEEMNRTLEQRVKERTAELSSKNEELQAALHRLRETQEQLVAKEKLASLGALTAGIAHEIKNPLNFVINFAELSRDQLQELRAVLEGPLATADAAVKDDVDDLVGILEQNAKKINEHGKRADSIVKNMLLHSRGRSGDRQPGDVNALVEEYLNLAYHGMRAADPTFNVEIKKDLDPAVGRADLIPQDFGRALLNVVNNALYAAHERKKDPPPSGWGIRPLSDHQPWRVDSSFTPQIQVVTRNLGDRFEIRVRDNGAGMPAEVVEKIYHPFFTTKPAGAGTGLGLSITHDIIVQLHGGEIRVETEEGAFTEFVLILPKAARA